MKKACIAVIATLFVLTTLSAEADPWIPPAGAGRVKPAVRWYSSDRTFAPFSWDSETFPSKTRFSETSLKVTGLQGLGDNWALQYDLRAASLQKTKKGKTRSASGLQDQEIGLVRGLRQGDSFADAIAFNVIFPTGSTSSDPQLGVGHFAVEPDYQFGIKHRFGSRGVASSFSIGPRFYFGGRVTQLRATARIGINLTRRVELFGTMFYARTNGLNNAAAATADPYASEIYNLLRGGVGLQFAVSRSLRPTIAYETDLAGRRIHAGQRFVVGFSWRY